MAQAVSRRPVDRAMTQAVSRRPVDRAMTQAVSRWSLTVEAWGQS